MALGRDDMLRELELLPMWRARHVEPQPEPIKSVSETAIVLPIENTLPPMQTIETEALVAPPDNVSAKPAGSLCVACSLASLNQSAEATIDGLLLGVAHEGEALHVSELFAGEQGELLNNMLAAIKLKLAAEHFIPFNSLQAAEVSTSLMLVIGESAAQNVLASDASLDELRGRLHVVGYRDSRHHVVVTYHPAHLLQHPADKAKAWQDLLLVKRAMADLQL